MYGHIMCAMLSKLLHAFSAWCGVLPWLAFWQCGLQRAAMQGDACQLFSGISGLRAASLECQPH